MLVRQGSFDYICSCDGTCCRHVGNQYQSATVIIEVPLIDQTVVFLKGLYEQSGYVLVENTVFYPEQFDDVLDENENYKANTIWTYEEVDNNVNVRRNCFKEDLLVNFTDEILVKCIARVI